MSSPVETALEKRFSREDFLALAGASALSLLFARSAHASEPTSTIQVPTKVKDHPPGLEYYAFVDTVTPGAGFVLEAYYNTAPT